MSIIRINSSTALNKSAERNQKMSYFKVNQKLYITNINFRSAVFSISNAVTLLCSTAMIYSLFPSASEKEIISSVASLSIQEKIATIIMISLFQFICLNLNNKLNMIRSVDNSYNDQVIMMKSLFIIAFTSAYILLVTATFNYMISLSVPLIALAYATFEIDNMFKDVDFCNTDSEDQAQ